MEQVIRDEEQEVEGRQAGFSGYGDRIWTGERAVSCG